MAAVKLRNISKFYGDFQALRNIDLDVADGEFVVFVGPSGCGKSTLLRTIAGLEGSYSGLIEIGGRDVSRAAPSERGVAMVFQSYALYPHMSVRDNMDFGMRVNGVEKSERDRRIAEAARILQLEPYLDRKPAHLSGGQRQRVAIGRAILREPQVFLFDEPLSNLDAKLRVAMRIELESLHRQLRATMIYVTHDQVEAMTMADKIVVLNGGRIEQVGAPMDLYHRPASRFVADFIGSPSMNFLAVAVEQEGGQGAVARYGDARLMLPPLAAPVEGRLTLGVRPEHLRIGEQAGEGMAGTIEGRIAVKETLGGETILHIDTRDGDRVTVKTDGESTVRPDEHISLAVPKERIHLFAADGAAIARREP
ncbi:ABC transporter ATP-binding protein [Chelativorans intermedius]|uniref:ABC transporter ATP-binding protein n=1 Tax=Chelativorans intermedius TaxID=515947 RepID=A0ABV6D6C2_9HYPH|nr:sn-glycerol-3-phosphate ABC transporter ATP-binding protein UgpC [Chelativorans intermedius]MCT8999431.1 sn-glycerol-3-phosphate ABC transporter ATP-binding protein UgpC [Chelativorans intermedius]